MNTVSEQWCARAVKIIGVDLVHTEKFQNSIAKNANRYSLSYGARILKNSAASVGKKSSNLRKFKTKHNDKDLILTF